jgi:hypothetical protein
MYPTVHPRGKVPELFKKDINRAVEKFQIRLKPAEKGKRGRKRKRLHDRIPEKKNQKNQKNQNKLKSALSEKPDKSGRGRPRKRVSFKENSEQSDDEADAAPRIRTRSGREVKRPRRD